MGLGDWIHDALDSTSNALNVVDRYINPFHHEVHFKNGKKTNPEGHEGAWSDEMDAFLHKVPDAIPSPVKSGFEEAMSGMRWLRDNGVSQPISSFLLMAKHARASDDDPLGLSSRWFSTSDWAKSWHVANHVSPGQAFLMNKSEGERVLQGQPLYATPAAAALPAGWKDMSEDEQQAWLKEAGMPIIGNRAVEAIKRDNSLVRYSSGALDFAAAWWLDPVIVGGKAAGAAKAKYVTKAAPRGGRSLESIDELMQGSNMARAERFLYENRSNPALINNLTMARKSAMGPRMGAIVSQLQTPEEIHLFLRTGLGDTEARALLESQNAAAAARLQQDTARLPALDLALTRTQEQMNPAAEAMVKARQAQLNAQIAADESLTARYGAALDHYGELDQLNLTRFSFGRAERRTKAQAAYRAGPAGAMKATPRGASPALGVSRVGGDGSFFGTPLTLIRAFKEAHPNGWMAIDDIHKESVDELRAHLARIPGIGPDIRQDLLNQYLKTSTEGERLDLLDKVGRLGLKKIGEKHGLTTQEAEEVYRESRRTIGRFQDSVRRYSGTRMPGEPAYVDEFDMGGGRLALHPTMATQLANNHVLLDLKEIDRTLARHSGALKALREKGGSTTDWVMDRLDYMNHLWKFGALFRMGYLPRVLSDDLAGQVARLGAATMALRTGYGVKNLATNLAHWKPASMYAAREAAAREGVAYADEELAPLVREADYHRAEIGQRREIAQRDLSRARDRLRYSRNALNALGPDAREVSVRARQGLVAKHEANVARLEGALARTGQSKQARLADLDEQIHHLNEGRAARLQEAEDFKLRQERGFRQSSQLYKQPEVRGVVLPPALGGERGEYYQKLISSDDSLRNLFASNKKLVHGNLMRSYGTAGVAMSYPQDPKIFVQSWHQAINNQIMQDQLGSRAVRLLQDGRAGNEAIGDMTHWLSSTPAGRAYRKRLGLKYTSGERIASGVYHEVADYLPTQEVRQAALEGAADIPFLERAAANGMHPQEVHSTQLAEQLAGSNHVSRAMDRVVDKWFKTVAALPADKMARHPLFNQLYEGHARQLVAQELKQGEKVAQGDADRIAETARRLALRDTRKLVFDIAHRSDVGHMLRFVSPFFSATTEAWQRWARIIADRPQVVGYAQQFYNAPTALGWMQDRDGNRIGPDGTIIDPVTGKKRLIPKSERYIMARVPGFIAKGPVGKVFGMDTSGSWLISQDSMNLVTQGDPFFNPGTGPIAAIPVNEFVKDKPAAAELARHLGVLPFGPQTGTLLGSGPLGRAADIALPATIRNFLTAFDTSDDRYQRIKLQIMQRAAYEHAALGKPMPTAKEIASRTRNYWLWSAVTSFSQPFATQKPDRYQFFRDQYNTLRRKDPETADDEFLKRYGESFFVFAQESSDSSGVPPTKRAIQLEKQYGDLIEKNPELASLIVGPEGKGPFSPEAYAYQLTTPLIPGGAEMQRRKLSADEAMAENRRRLGWAQYTKLANAVTAELHRQGFKSFSDDGAENLRSMKAGIARLLGDPMLPTGEPNPYYNKDWSLDYSTYDDKKYDRIIPALTEVAHSRLAQEGSRSDLRTLQTYLTGRQALLQVLHERAKAGGAKTLQAKANSDLATAWAQWVDGLVESDIRFGDLHHRYLSRDLGVNLQEVTQ